MPDLRQGSRACVHDGTGDSAGGRKVQCQGCSREAARERERDMYDSHVYCRFIEGARATLSMFLFAFRRLDLALCVLSIGLGNFCRSNVCLVRVWCVRVGLRKVGNQMEVYR